MTTRIRLSLLAIALALLPLAGAACDDNSSGQSGDVCLTAGWRCSTPACSQFVQNPGCDDVPPVAGHCPLTHSRCFNPATAMGFCDPAAGLCVKARTTPPMSCAAPGTTCQSTGEVTRCYDPADGGVICRTGATCNSVCADAGVQDMAMPIDLPFVDE